MNRNSFAVLATGVAALTWACGGGERADDAPADAPAEAPAAQTEMDAPSGEMDFAAVTYPEGVTAAMAQAGADMWSTQICATCHGADAGGVADLGPDLTDGEWLNSDGTYEAIVATITNGVQEPKQFATPMMPKGGMPSITEEQVRQLAAYIFALSRS